MKSNLGTGMKTMTTNKTTTTTTAIGYPFSDAPLLLPDPQCGLRGGRVGRGEEAGPVLGCAMMTMTMLGLGLELFKNSKYFSLYWTRGNSLPCRITKPSMNFPCPNWTCGTRPVGISMQGWGRWIGRRMPYLC